MSTNEPGVIIGLTGGIATGKSTVSRFFQALGVEVIDADRLAREIVEPGKVALQEIVDTFGDALLNKDGTLNRSRLGVKIFQDDEARKAVEAITHPRIAQAMFDQARQHFEAGHQWVLYDAALLVETGTHRFLDALIVVDCPASIQRRRLRQRDQLDADEAQQRMDSQMPLEDKRQAADFIIDNGGSLDDTREQVQQLKRRIDTLIETHGTATPRRDHHG